ncbi:hypothetical protein [Legionella sp. CNM-4043-24]|uniref:hypothetical protein n=1 Tax=Legionella sp. CNM-4043-24 TaxID=3421646 RepID=UPI00403A90A6
MVLQILKSRTVLLAAFLLSEASFAQDTELHLFRPFDKARVESVQSQQAIDGECWQQSQRIKREDAWRCSAEGKVYDPCFIKTYGDHRQALCAQAPWLSSETLLTLANPADNSHHSALDMSRTYPWAMELSNGEQCLAVDEGHEIDNMPVRYICSNQAQLLGHLQRCKAEWSMLRRSADGQVDTVAIAQVWF